MMHEVRIAAPAQKALDRLPADVAERVRDALRALRIDPRRKRSGADIKKLHSVPGVFRLRIGEYRAFYVIFPEEPIVYVTSIRHRSQAYD